MYSAQDRGVENGNGRRSGQPQNEIESNRFTMRNLQKTWKHVLLRKGRRGPHLDTCREIRCSQRLKNGLDHQQASVRIVVLAQKPVKIEIGLGVLVSPLMMLQVPLNLTCIHPSHLRHLAHWKSLGESFLDIFRPNLSLHNPFRVLLSLYLKVIK